MNNFLDFFLSKFKWYRQKRGGTWYYILEHDVSGIAAPGSQWVRELPKCNDYTLIAQEKYS